MDTFCAVKILMLTALNNVTWDLFHDTNGHSYIVPFLQYQNNTTRQLALSQLAQNNNVH